MHREGRKDRNSLGWGGCGVNRLLIQAIATQRCEPKTLAVKYWFGLQSCVQKHFFSNVNRDNSYFCMICVCALRNAHALVQRVHICPQVSLRFSGVFEPFEKQVVTATLQRIFILCIPRKGIARPQSQFPHSCVQELSIYSHRSEEYINRSQKHGSRNWDCSRACVCFEFEKKCCAELHFYLRVSDRILTFLYKAKYMYLNYVASSSTLFVRL